MGFINKKPFGGPRFFAPERGAIDRGGHDSSFRVVGPLAWGGAIGIWGGGAVGYLIWHHCKGMPCTQCEVLDVGKYSHPSYLLVVKH